MSALGLGFGPLKPLTTSEVSHLRFGHARASAARKLGAGSGHGVSVKGTALASRIFWSHLAANVAGLGKRVGFGVQGLLRLIRV